MRLPMFIEFYGKMYRRKIERLEAEIDQIAECLRLSDMDYLELEAQRDELLAVVDNDDYNWGPGMCWCCHGIPHTPTCPRQAALKLCEGK